MSGDPAVDAAQAAFLEQWPEQGEFEFRHSIEGQFGRDAAREALKPIRELHRKRNGRAIGFGDMPNEDFCNECSTMGQHVPWPCATARVVYPESELA